MSMTFIYLFYFIFLATGVLNLCTKLYIALKIYIKYNNIHMKQQNSDG